MTKETNKIFANSAKYYDIIYRTKDVAAEVQYLHDKLTDNGIKCGSILELGVGTGRHAGLLIKKGYEVTGLDKSSEMLKQARTIEKLKLHHGDARSFDLKKRFDAVLSLFHVMSYQSSNKDVVDTLECINQHLSINGIFIFDIWFGPAVFHLGADCRVTIAEDDLIKITRIAEPELHDSKNIVDVKYKYIIHDKKLKTYSEFEEIHSMRHYTYPEIEYFLNVSGFKILCAEEWQTGRPLSRYTWSASIICKKL